MSDLNFDNKDKKRNSILIIVAALLIVIAVVCVVMIIVTIRSGRKTNKEQESTTVETTTEQPTTQEPIMQAPTTAAPVVDTPEPQESSAADNFNEVSETITAKEAVHLRSTPNQTDSSNIVATLYNGEKLARTGISDSGWSRLEYNGQIVYAVSNYLTTDLNYTPPTTEPDDGIKTEFKSCNDTITAKEAVNLRTIPSVTNPDSQVVVTLKKGETVSRTGIAEAQGWSRVVYNGQTLYCVTSYTEVVQ